MPTVTLTLEEFDEYKNRTKIANDEAAELRKQIADLKLASLDSAPETAKALVEIVRDSLSIVRFAVANLPPESTRGWPFRTLRRIVERIAMLPDYTSDDRDLSGELNAFARECEAYEHRRNVKPDEPKKSSTDPTLAMPENTSPGI